MRQVASDEELMTAVQRGEESALSALFTRYAPLVYHMAAQSLGQGSAEELVQDVFFSVWTKAQSYERGRGLFRPWLLQIAHFRVLNELRRRSRRPRLEPGLDGDSLEELADGGEGPLEQAWSDYRREALRAAVDSLPPSQRQALSLAFFEELSHDQVAQALKLPIGTVKTRIRHGLRSLRRILLPLGVAGLLGLALVGLGWAFEGQRLAAARGVRALAFATESDLSLIHLPAAPGQDARTHGSYRGREGSAMAVVALHNLPPSPGGGVYRVWVRHGASWTLLGSARLAEGGDAVVVGEGGELRALPEAVEVRLESGAGGASPQGRAVISWEAAAR